MANDKLVKIDSIMFLVSDLEGSSRFYENTLGLKRVWEDEDMGMIGFVFPESDSEIVIHTDTTLPNPDFSFLVNNVEQFCTDFEAQGCEVLFGPIEVRCGKFAVLSDPDGNRIPIIDLTKFGGRPKYSE